MPVYLLDESVMVDVLYEEKDCDFKDNICMTICEDCPDEEKIFRAELSNIYMTVNQARQLARLLVSAAEQSEEACPEEE